MKVSELTPELKAILWGHGAMKAMCELGLMKGGSNVITTKGIAMFDQIDKESPPTDEDLAEFVLHTFPKENSAAPFMLLKKYRDDRQGILDWVKENMD